MELGNLVFTFLLFSKYSLCCLSFKILAAANAILNPCQICQWKRDYYDLIKVVVSCCLSSVRQMTDCCDVDELLSQVVVTRPSHVLVLISRITSDITSQTDRCPALFVSKEWILR